MAHRRRSKKIAGAVATAIPPPRAQRNPIITGVICFLLVAIVWIVFAQTLRHEFVNYDDDVYVYKNPRVSAGLTSDGIQWAFRGVYASNWHPLTTLSHMLDCQLYGLESWGHHRTNVLLHAAAAVLLFLALRRLTDAFWPSALVAALFAIHPLRVESVAWIAERKDVLSGVFFMLVLWAYARFAQADRMSWTRYSIVVVLFALGLMSKPTLVTLPLVLLLLDYWPLRRFAAEGRSNANRWSHPVLEKIPLLVLSAASGVMTIRAQGTAIIPVSNLTVLERVGNAGMAYLTYLFQTIYPTRLVVAYPYPENHVNIIQAILALLLLATVSIAFFFWRKPYPFLLIGWLWFLGMLVPMIGLIQVGDQPHNDRYTYLPQIGLFLMVIWGAAAFAAKLHVHRAVIAALASIVLTAFTAVSYIQASYWRNSETLWRHALANTVKNGLAENNLGDALMKQKRRDEALAHFRNALQIYPNDPESNNHLGVVLASRGNWSEAITLYQTALRIRPGYAEAHHNLGVSLAETGKTDDAIKHFREALSLDPSLVDAHWNLATALLRLGQRDEAIAHLQEALRLKPNDAEIQDRLRTLGVSK